MNFTISITWIWTPRTICPFLLNSRDFLRYGLLQKGVCEGLKVKIQKVPSNIAPLREMIVHPSSYEIKS